MFYKDIDIIKQADGSFLLSSNSVSSIINEDTLVLDTIFWYPLMEMDYLDFFSVLQNRGCTDFPIALLIKSVILNGTFYWISLSLERYLKLNSYNVEIQLKLNSLLLELRDTKFQDFKKKLKNVLTIKNRFYVDELYKLCKNDKSAFVEKLIESKIVYTEYYKENIQYIISNGKKYPVGV